MVAWIVYWERALIQAELLTLRHRLSQPHTTEEAGALWRRASDLHGRMLALSSHSIWPTIIDLATMAARAVAR